MSLVMSLERRIMAHRYLHFILKTPIITDAEYDDLIKRAWSSDVPDDSDIFQLPSRNIADYNQGMAADAKLLQAEASQQCVSIVPIQPANSTVATPTNRAIYVVGHMKEYACWMQGFLVDKMEDAKLVVFTGGEDVTPSYYGAKPHSYTLCSPKRDRFEKLEFDRARGMGLPIIGICRGAQFLCVMAGGKLVQHQENPYHIHRMTIEGTKEIFVTSSHHQAQFPWHIPYTERRLLGWTTLISEFHEDGDGKEMVKGGVDVPGGPYDYLEVEECYYKKINALALQHHPEWHYPPMDADKREYLAHCRTLLDGLMNGTLMP